MPDMSLTARAFRMLVVAIPLALTLLLTACGPSEQQRVESIYALAATNPAGAQAEIVKQWNAHTIKLDTCINLAHSRLEQGGAGQTGAIAFAVAVLGAAKDLATAADQSGVTEFYWFRLGTLAGAGAAAALNQGDLPTARALVLAGPRRWQGENYWRMHPDHDALASWIMHKSGESTEAIARLRERGEPDEQVVRMIERIRADQRAATAAASREKSGNK